MGDTPFGSGKSPQGSIRSARSPAILCEALGPFADAGQFVLRVDFSCKLVAARRTAMAFERAADIESCFRQIEEALVDIPRRDYTLLVDTRGGPSRNDSTFESVAAAHRGKLLLGFARNAALAATAAGRLQIQRFAKVDGRVVFATDSVSAAFEYLGLPPHAV
jgi:hypothetical protein